MNKYLLSVWLVSLNSFASQPLMDKAQINNIHFSKPAEAGDQLAILFTSVPEDDFYLHWMSCIRPDTMNPNHCIGEPHQQAGNEKFENNRSHEIPLSVAERTENLYLHYCMDLSASGYNSSDLYCGYEKIGALKSTLNDSYFSQGNDFNMYDTTQNNDVVTSGQSLLFKKNKNTLFLEGKGPAAKVDTSLLTDVNQVYSLLNDHVVLTNKGELYTWGKGSDGLNLIDQHVKEVYPSVSALAYVKDDGVVKSFGDVVRGGYISDTQKSRLDELLNSGGRVTHIYHTSEAFLAVVYLANGKYRVVPWGDENHGGNLPPEFDNELELVEVISNQNSFSLLLENGDVYFFGEGEIKIISNIETVKANRFAFAGITTEGNIKTWGQATYGGVLNKAALDFSKQQYITDLCSTDSAFLMFSKTNTGALAWGSSESGGSIPNYIQTGLINKENTPRTQCRGNEGAFVLFDDDWIYAWGDAQSGGVLPNYYPVQGQKTVVANNRAFMLATDDEIVTWGKDDFGGQVSPGHVYSLGKDLDINAIYRTMKKPVFFGTFHGFTEDESLSKTGFYIKGRKKIVSWGNATKNRVLELN